MPAPLELLTPRLRIRPWRNEDLPPFAALNADPEVRRFFPGVQTAEQSNASAARMRAYYQRDGHSFLPVELRETGEFIGFVGIITGTDTPGYEGEPEIGWRLAREYWRRGYAYEAAAAWLEFGFRKLGFPRVIAITSVDNLPSMALMKKLGMRHVGNFGHPKIDPGSPVYEHVIYLLKRGEWRPNTPTDTVV